KPILFDELDLSYIGKLSLSDGGNCTPTIYTGTQGAITTKPTGTAAGLTQGITTYPTPTSTRYVATLGLVAGNQEHKTFTIPVYNFASRRGAVGVQLTITPTITKNNTQIMTYTFEMSWARYEPT